MVDAELFMLTLTHTLLAPVRVLCSMDVQNYYLMSRLDFAQFLRTPLLLFR